MSQRNERPVAVINFYPKRLVARIQEVSFSYRIIVIMICVLLILALAQLSSRNPDEVIRVVKALAAVLK
jgi:hypothetical protein